MAAPPSQTQSGEDRLIARHFAPIARHPGALGLTDDAAVIAPPAGHELVVTTDAIVGGVHFFLRRSARRGREEGVAGQPLRSRRQRRQAARLPVDAGAAAERRRRLARRLRARARRGRQTYDCPLLGGDTVCTPGPLTISITAFGTVPDGTMVRRSGARAGDRVFVTGTIGDAALGLAAAQERGRRAAGARRCDAAPLLARYLVPRAAQCAGRCVAPPRLRRHGRVGRSRRRSRQALPRLRRRRR